MNSFLHALKQIRVSKKNRLLYIVSASIFSIFSIQGTAFAQDAATPCNGSVAFIQGQDGAKNALAWISNGDGTFKTTPITTATGLSRYGVGSGVFGRADASSTMFADVDNDGDIDIVAATENSNNGIYVYMNNGDNTFATTPVVSTPMQSDGSGKIFAGITDAEESWLRDTNGDGILDYVFSNDSDKITVWFGHGDGTFNTSWDKQTALLGAGGRHTSGISGSESFFLDDATGDGIVDLIGTYDASPANIVVWKGNGDGTFAPNLYYTRSLEDTGGSHSSGSADNEYSQFADVNKDGFLDYIHAESYNSTPDIWVWLNDGTGKFPTAPIRTAVPNAAGYYPPGGLGTFANYTGSALSFFYDLNGDGAADFVTTNDNTGANSGISVYLANGDGTFATTPINTLISGFRTGINGSETSYIGCGFVAPSAICSSTAARPVLSASSIQNTCPTATVNLNSITATNKPTGATLTWHTGPTASNANKISNPTSYSVSGVVYAAFYDAVNDCYGAKGAATRSVNVAINSCVSSGVGTIDCAKTQLAPVPVVGSASQVMLVVTLNVTTAGSFAVSASGSGMMLANGITSVSTTTTGIQKFYIPLKYDGTALGTLNFTVGTGSCTADLSSNLAKKSVVSDVWTLDNCTQKVVAPTLK